MPVPGSRRPPDRPARTPRCPAVWIVVADEPGFEQRPIEIDVIDATTGADATSRRRRVTMSRCSSLAVDALALRAAATVRVRVHGAARDGSDWSDPLDVEAGLLGAVRLDGASPITADFDGTAAERPVRLRREFDRPRGPGPRPPVRTALGVYKVRSTATGRRRVLAPGWTATAIGCATRPSTSPRCSARRQRHRRHCSADGWYRGRLGFRGGRRAIYGTETGLIAQLEITTPTAAPTRSSPTRLWRRARPGHSPPASTTARPNDARARRPRRGRPGLRRPPTGPRSTSWTPSPISWSPPTGPPVRRIETLRPVKVAASPAGHIVDFGQNIAGRVRIRVRGRPGTRSPCAMPRSWSDGELAMRPLRGARRPTATSWRGDGAEDLRAALHVPRVPLRRGRRLARRADAGRRRGGRLPHRHAAHRLVRLLRPAAQPAARECRSGACAATSSTCPPTARSATNGSAGPATSRCSPRPRPSCTTAPASSLVAGGPRRRADASRHCAALRPVGRPRLPLRPAAAWGDAAVVVPWVLYQRFGDSSMLAQQYDSMRAWVDQIAELAGDEPCGTRASSSATGSTRPRPPTTRPRRETDRALVATAYHAHTASLLANRRRARARRGRGALRRARRAGRRAAFNGEFVTPAGRLASDAQTAYALALRFDLLPTPSNADAPASAWSSWSAGSGTASAPASSARR